MNGKLLSLLILCTLASYRPAWSATPLVPPLVQDMILLGQEGLSGSTVTRRVSIAGNYVYCSGEPGLQTVNVANPSNLTLTHDFTATSLKTNGTAIKDQHLYMANWSPHVGLEVFSLANPAQPARVRTLGTSLHTWEAEVFGNLLYLTIGAELDSGVNTYDISDPANPVLIHAFTIGDRLLNNVVRFGDYMYFTHKSELRVYNAANPSNPQFVRTLTFNSLLGNLRVHQGHLYMLGRQVLPGEEGGIRVLSLVNPAHPQLVGFWMQPEPRDMLFLGDFCIVPCSGSGVYTLSVANPQNVFAVANWGVSWPGSGPHGGYPVCVTGSGRHAYIGTTSANDPACEDFDCPHYGARLYAVKVLRKPPIIAEVQPDPEEVLAFEPYVRQLVLTEGVQPVEWSVVRGPPGIEVSTSGLVSGWTPELNDIGQLYVFEIRASNEDGVDTETWSVRVRYIAHGDFDGDGDSDQSDFGHLQRCFSGDTIPFEPGCGNADFDSDGDVDGNDFNLFWPCMQGANIPAGC